MRSVLPGRPRSTLHAVDTAEWEGQRFVVYISSNALVILRGAHDLLQTITHRETDELTAVAIDGATGKIATTNGSEVIIHKPVGQDIGALRWSLQGSFTPTHAFAALATLSWGLADEVLLGGSYLTLLNTSTQLRTTWQSRPLANRVAHALFSHDAGLIASAGHCDRLVKIWRRGFIGGGNERFDPVYLGHPATVTGLRWRGRPGKSEDGEEQHAEPILYTICVDGKIRVWTANDPHCLQVLQLWAEIDMNMAIQPRDPLSPTPWKKRYVFIIDQWDFKQALASVTKVENLNEREQHTQGHLQDVGSRDPEIAIILDEQGNMSAWGLERVGCKARHDRDVVNIAHAENIGLRFPSEATDNENNLLLQCFARSDNKGRFQLLGHFFDGRLQWLASRIDQLLDPSPAVDSLTLETEMTGHDSSIDGIASDAARKILLTWSVEGEIIVWSQNHLAVFSGLVRRSVGRVASQIHNAALTPDGDFAIISKDDQLLVFDTRRSSMLEMTRSQTRGLSISSSSMGRIFAGHGEGASYWIPLSSSDFEAGCLVRLQIEGYSAFLHTNERLTTCTSTTKSINISIDGRAPASDFRRTVCLDLSHERKALSCTEDGVATVWSHSMPAVRDQKIEWRAMKSCSLGSSRPDQTAMSQSCVQAAVVTENRTALEIWRVPTGHLEHTEKKASHDTILDIVWTTFSNDAIALAVAFAHRVELWCPTVIDQQACNTAWLCVKQLRMGDLTSYSIASIMWTAAEDVVVAAGNQLFVLDTSIGVPDAIADLANMSLDNANVRRLSTVVAALSLELASYHPSSIAALISYGLLEDVAVLLAKLHGKLKYYSDGDELSSRLGYEDRLQLTDRASRTLDSSQDEEDSDGSSTTSMATADFSKQSSEDLSSKLEENRIPWLAMRDQVNLVKLVKSFGKIWQHQQSTDIMGLHYLHQLYFNHDSADEASSNIARSTWKQIFWASQTRSQDVLTDLTSSQRGGRMGWEEARKSGMFLWLSDLTALRSQIDGIAKHEYNSTDERNPIDCSLFYLALRKKQTLVGLWRLAHWHREQRATYKMLQNDFSSPKWRTAALKNAYALLGKRRTEYAAAFFVLADDLRSAATVLYDQMGDLQLAIAVVRGYEGDDGAVLRDLLQDKVLRTAVKENNRWMAAWAFWLRGRKTDMLKAFIEPLHILVADTVPAEAEYRTLDLDDPSLASAYQHVRDAILADPRESEHAKMMSPRSEHELVACCSALYMRMGCGMLALNLLSTFKFTRPSNATPTLPMRNASAINGEGAKEESPSMLEAFEDSLGTKGQDGNLSMTLNGSAAPMKKIVEEPSTASILDSFDF